jgi:WhiB family transcriptional regulator, redox-sensing transcriptional regulator
VAWRAGIDRGPTLDEQLGRCRPSWFDRAACRGIATGLFYPGHGDPGTEARAVCAGFPVSGPCGQLAAANHEAHGIWGGLTRNDRRAQRSTRQGRDLGARWMSKWMRFFRHGE